MIRDLLIIGVFSSCLATGCSTDHSVPLTQAEVVKYAQIEIERIDASRDREKSAQNFEQAVAKTLLAIDGVLACDVRLVSGHYCLGPVSRDDPFYCVAAITFDQPIDPAQFSASFHSAFDTLGLNVSSNWPNPFVESLGDEPLAWSTDGSTIVLEYALVYPIGSKSSPTDFEDFQPVRMETDAQNP